MSDLESAGAIALAVVGFVGVSVLLVSTGLSGQMGVLGQGVEVVNTHFERGVDGVMGVAKSVSRVFVP